MKIRKELWFGFVLMAILSCEASSGVSPGAINGTRMTARGTSAASAGKGAAAQSANQRRRESALKS